MRKPLRCDSSDLIQLPLHSSRLFALGYTPAKSTFCFGELSTEFADAFEENEFVIIRFIEGAPVQLIELTSKQAEEKELQDNEVKIKVGSYFLTNFKFQKNKP